MWWRSDVGIGTNVLCNQVSACANVKMGGIGGKSPTIGCKKLQLTVGMCKTIEDSLFSGSLSYATGLFLIYKGGFYVWLGAFVIMVGSMQWVDALIWYRKKHGLSTDALSKYGVLTVLFLEPVIAYLGYVWYYGQRMIPYEIICALSLLNLTQIWLSKCKETPVTKDGYLKWCDIDFSRWYDQTIYFILLFFPFLYFPDVFMRNMMVVAGSVLLLYTLNHEAFGSRWCHIFYVVDALILSRLLYIT